MDNANAARLAVEHLLAQGHTRLVLVTASGRTLSRMEKIHGYLSAAREGGIERTAKVIEHKSTSAFGDAEMAELGRALAGTIAKTRPRATGIVAINDMLAIGLIAGLRSRGLDVPGDASVIGMDDIALSTLVSPAVTSIRLPLAAMAGTMVDRIMSRLGDSGIATGEFLFQPVLVTRGSVGPPGGDRRASRACQAQSLINRNDAQRQLDPCALYVTGICEFTHAYSCHLGGTPAISSPKDQAILDDKLDDKRQSLLLIKEETLDAPASIEVAKHVLLSCGIILAIGTITALVAQKIRIPDVAVFLIVGMFIGPEALGLIDIKADSALNQIILLFGASYILFDGGASLRFAVLKQVWITIVVIATAGVVITAAVTGIAAFWVLDIPLIVALLLGATLASTDPATLVPIFRQVHIRDRVAQTVMSESALNDAMGAIVTLGVLGVAMGTGEFSLVASAYGLLKQSIIGIVAGVVLGYVAAFIIAHERWALLKEHAPVVTLVAVIGAYFAADGLEASGFMAVFVFGIVVGNKDSFGFKMEESDQRKLEEYASTTAFIMRLFIFILLGAQVDFHLIGQHLVGGIIVIAVFMLVARPVTVFACALPDRRARWTINEMLFMCWTRETGVIPAALAGLLVGMKAPGAQLIASVTFIAILMTILIQAPTTRWLGGKLGLLEER